MIYYGSTNNFISVTTFQTVSFATTTGYVNSDYYLWPSLFSCYSAWSNGACAGSTGGRIKMIRVLVLYKQGEENLKN